MSLSDWRAEWAGILEAADRITVFSRDSHDLVSSAYPVVRDRIAFIPHQLLVEVPQIVPCKGRNGRPVIGVLGNIGYQKGAAVLRDLSRLLADSGAAELVIIGNLDPTYVLAPPAQVYGSYHIKDIPGLVVRYGITCWLIPSIGPETFSYTTHEALATGMPVWSFNLGAQGGAVAAAAAERGHLNLRLQS